MWFCEFTAKKSLGPQLELRRRGEGRGFPVRSRMCQGPVAERALVAEEPEAWASEQLVREMGTKLQGHVSPRSSFVESLSLIHI